MSDEFTRTVTRKIKDFLFRPFSWFVAALLSRDPTPGDER